MVACTGVVQATRRPGHSDTNIEVRRLPDALLYDMPSTGRNQYHKYGSSKLIDVFAIRGEELSRNAGGRAAEIGKRQEFEGEGDERCWCGHGLTTDGYRS
jgi:hypothetical protein